MWGVNTEPEVIRGAQASSPGRTWTTKEMSAAMSGTSPRSGAELFAEWPQTGHKVPKQEKGVNRDVQLTPMFIGRDDWI